MTLCVLPSIRPSVIPLSCLWFQNKYKEDGLKGLSQSFYSQLPDTAELQLAKSLSELQSQVSLTG